MIPLLERFLSLFCRHKWIHHRLDSGKFGFRCLKCMQQKEDDLARLLRA